MTSQEYRVQYLKWHLAYERKSFRIFRRAMKECFASMPISSINYDNYKFVIPLNIHTRPMQVAYIEVYRTVGLIHGRRVGLGINREMKRFDNDFFSKFFQDNLIDWIRDNVGGRIVSVSETIAKRIGRLVEVASEKGYSVDEMQKYLRERINDPLFTKYQATRIARTEVGGAANYAATVAAKGSGIVLEKIWIATKDVRTRRKPKNQFDHMHMDGKSVGQFEKFELRSKNGVVDHLDNPCDPKGSAADVINCRCIVAFKPKRDKYGFVITN